MARIVLEPDELIEWLQVQPILADIVGVGANRWPVVSMFLVSIFRPADANDPNRSGIHAAGPPYRAADGSARNFGGSVEDRWKQCARIAAAVNRRFIYDPRRPKLMVAVGKKHGTGPHVHFQCHPRTVHRRRS